MTRQPVWNFTPQPNKFGYENNPYTVPKEAATPVHTPCGYWLKEPTERDGSTYLGPMPFLAYVVESTSDPLGYGYVMCDMNLEPLFFVGGSEYDLYNEIQIDGVAETVLSYEENNPPTYEADQSSKWISMIDGSGTVIKNIGYYELDFSTSISDNIGSFEVTFSLGPTTIAEPGVDYLEMTTTPSGGALEPYGIFPPPANPKSLWNNPVVSLYDAGGNVWIARDTYNSYISKNQVNLTNAWSGYEEYSNKLYVGIRMFFNSVYVQTSTIQSYHAAEKTLAEIGDPMMFPCLLYSGTPTAAPTTCLDAVVGHTLVGDDPAGQSMFHHLYYDGYAEHRELYTHIIGPGYNNKVSAPTRYLMRRDDSTLYIEARAYDLEEIRSVMIAAGINPALVPTADNSSVDGNVIVLYDTSTARPPQ